jgi:APA family basic amino acid/polyamine antiporter
VFAIVNVAVLILRKDTVDHDHFHTHTVIALVGAAACLYLVTPLSGRAGEQYQVAGLLLLVGLVLSVPIYLYRRAQGENVTIDNPDDIV